MIAARRHAQQGPPGRQRHPRRLAGRGQGRGRRRGPAAVAPPRRRGRARAAGADDERAQRRRPRRQQGRLPGVHGRARGRARRFSEALRMGAEVFHALKKSLHERGLAHRGRRRGRLRARLRLQRGGAAGADRGHRGGRATRRATTSRSRWTRPPARSTPAASTSSSTRAARCLPRRWRRTGPTWPASTRSSRSRTAWTRRTGTAGRR